MTYPPQGQPSDPYGQPQPYSQPPADGFAPGQAGPGYGPPQPQYTQPDAGQGGYQQPPPPGPQPGFPDPYGQHLPPPVQATNKGSAGTAVLVVVVLILMIGGGVAGYLLLRDDEGATTTAGDDTSESTEAAPEEEPTEDGGDGGDGPAPDGESMIVESLGAVTPAPGEPWEHYMGPGETGNLSEDTDSYYIQHTESWISYMEVGLASALYAPYDPADLRGSALEALTFWTSSTAFSSTEGLTVTDPVLTDAEVDGRPAVTAEATISWAGTSSTTDLYEEVTIVLVDVDGVNGFLGLASVPESGTPDKPAAIDALLATTFEGETA